MKITCEDDELVVRIPLKQNQYNHYEGDDAIGVTANVIGVIANQEYTLSHLIDMSYCGKQQEGSPILYFDTREELEKVCEEHSIDILEYSTCTFPDCGKVLRGVSGYGENGEQCCEHGV